MTCRLFRWAARRVERDVTAALNTPPRWARAEVMDFEPSDQFEMPPSMGIDYVPGFDETEDFCGCCGKAAESLHWCNACIEHIGPRETRSGRAIDLWERTYFAQYGIPCPYQVSGRP
jgi:hypothetical protein